jgi:outer membrane receptor protein involved in Fe transport
VRHANLIELFEPQNGGLWSEGGDPCAGPTPSMSLAACQNTGVTAAQYGLIPASPAGQYNGVFGGNPDLDPEKANTFTVGGVFNAEQYVPGLQFSVDYWNIEVKDAIGSVEPFTIISQCGATADPTLCSLINRGPNGNLWVNPNNAFVTSTNVNIGFFETAGIDFTGGYTWDLTDYGGLDFVFRGTLITKWDQQEIPGGVVDDCVGEWGGACSRPTPKWKHNFMSIWTTPWDLVFVGTWRMVGGVDELTPSAHPASVGPADVGSQHYIDLTAEYTPQFIGIGETKITVGVTNLTDNDPPVSGRFGNVAVYGNGNTIPGTWDALGRYFFFGVSQKF